MNSCKDLKSVETGSWFHNYIDNTLWKKYRSGFVGTISFIEFESMTACLSGKIPLEEIFKFKHSKTKDNSIAPC